MERSDHNLLTTTRTHIIDMHSCRTVAAAGTCWLAVLLLQLQSCSAQPGLVGLASEASRSMNSTGRAGTSTAAAPGQAARHTLPGTGTVRYRQAGTTSAPAHRASAHQCIMKAHSGWCMMAHAAAFGSAAQHTQGAAGSRQVTGLGRCSHGDGCCAGRVAHVCRHTLRLVHMDAGEHAFFMSCATSHGAMVVRGRWPSRPGRTEARQAMYKADL
jgi:hypothetical protein